jgi:hypothetical protein
MRCRFAVWYWVAGEGSNHDSGPVFILVPPDPPYSSRLLKRILTTINQITAIRQFYCLKSATTGRAGGMRKAPERGR